MPFKIPEAHEKPIETMANLSAQDREALVEAMKAAKPVFSFGKLVDQLAPHLALKRNEIGGILSVIFALYALRDQHRFSIDALVEEIVQSVEAQKIVDVSEGERRGEFVSLLKDVLSLDETIGVTAKAHDVLIQQANPFISARVLSDLRPVFVSSDSPSIAAALIVHNLKISAARSTDAPPEDFFFALDSNDLKVLQEVIARAIKKDEELRAFLDRSDLAFIDPD